MSGTGQLFPKGADAEAVRSGSSFTADQGLKYDAATGLFVPEDFVSTAALTAELAAYATDADVTAAIDALVDGAPGTLDTLNEIAAALADDDSAIGALTTALTGKESTTVETPTGVTYATGWSDFGGTYQGLAYYKDRGRVYLRGAVKRDATGTTLVATLPSGYRPPGTTQMFLPIFGGSTVLTIGTDGTLTVGSEANAKVITIFDVASFRL